MGFVFCYIGRGRVLERGNNKYIRCVCTGLSPVDSEVDLEGLGPFNFATMIINNKPQLELDPRVRSLTRSPSPIPGRVI